MTDTEKKIAEIREALEKIDRGDLFEIAMAYEKSGEWVRFLLDELEKLEREYAEERAAHNAHVAELCRVEEDNRKRFVIIAELVSERERLTKENRKLREECDKLIEWIKSALVGAMKESCRHETPDPTWHCCDWAELVEKAREIGVTVE